MDEQIEYEFPSEQEVQYIGLLKGSNFTLPVLRPIVDEVFYATQGGPFNIRTLAARVEQDKQLGIKILEICAKPYYSGQTPIRSLAQVIQRLGPTGFRCVAMQAYLDLEIYPSSTWRDVLGRIKNYSIVIGHISRIISRMTSIHGDTAYLCGLLHRIGMTVPLLDVPDPRNDPPLAQEAWTNLSLAHPQVASYILKSWGLPDEIVLAVGNYHQVIVNDEPNLLAATIMLAESVAADQGLPFRGMSSSRGRERGGGEAIAVDAADAICVLGFGESELARISKESRRVLKSIRIR
jgi:HD-like signal output (HDOD) protein